MDEQTPHPQILPQSQQPPAPEPASEVNPPTAPAAVPTVPPWKNKKIVLVTGIIILIVLIAAVISSMQKAGPSTNQTPVSSSPTPIPTPVRKLTVFATESAFASFESAVESLPEVIRGASVQDPTIVPPVLNLDLGF